MTRVADSGPQMGQRSSNPLVRLVATGKSADSSAPLSVGHLESGKLIVSGANSATLAEALDMLTSQYGGIFVVARNCSLCEWRSTTQNLYAGAPLILMIPSFGDAVQDVYDARKMEHIPAYKAAIRDLGHTVGMPLLDIDV